MVIEANLTSLMHVLSILAFRVEKLQEPSQVDDSYGLKAEGNTLSQDAEWIKVRLKLKQLPQKQKGKISSKLDLGKDTDKTMVGKAFMASPTSFPTKDLSEKTKTVTPNPKEVRKVRVRYNQTRWDVLSPPAHSYVMMPAGLGSRATPPYMESILFPQAQSASNSTSVDHVARWKRILIHYLF